MKSSSCYETIRCRGDRDDVHDKLPPRPIQRRTATPSVKRNDRDLDLPTRKSKRGNVKMLTPRSKKIVTSYFRKSTNDASMATSVLLVYLLYPSIVRLSFSSLECIKICSKTLLQQDHQEICWQGRHLKIATLVSIPCILLFAVLIPLLALIGLKMNQKKMFTKRKFTFRYGMLYSGYRKERWWWEIIIWWRKLAMIVVVTQGREWVRQLHLALAIMIVSLHVQHYGAPFDNTVIGKRLHSVEGTFKQVFQTQAFKQAQISVY